MCAQGFSALCSFVWKLAVTRGGRGKTHRGKFLLTVELKSKECFRLWKVASRSLAPDCEHSCFGKGNLEKVRCGEDGDFHIAAEDIHSFFLGLIARGWCTIISAHKLSTPILNSAPSICVCMSWAEASGMGQNTLELQPNWWQRVWKVSLETCGLSYWSNRFFVLSLYRDAIFSSLGWNMKWEVLMEKLTFFLVEKVAFSNLVNYSEILGKTCHMAFHKMLKLSM